jgi:glycosyltransferase involved in cell wall biosynthesis
MVTARYFPFMGGIETHVYEVGRRLVQQGIDVTIVSTRQRTADTHSLLPREETIEGMHIRRVSYWPAERDYYIAPEIYTLITQGNWDIVHCQGSHTFVPPMAMLAAKQAGIPYVITFHTGGNSSRLRTAVRDVQWTLQRPLYRGAAKLIGVSHFEADYFRNLLRLSRKRFVVIPNGGATFPALSSHRSTSSDTLIISPGRLERYKGHQNLITALPAIREQRPDARLLILGTGPYEEELRRLAQQTCVSDYVDIRAIPATDRRGMAETLSSATVVALLSEYEAHPVAVMEAITLQRPVVVAATSGLHEIAQQGLAREIPLRSTPNEVANAILHQIEEPLTLPSDLTLPTWNECAERVEAVYRDCVKSGERTREDVCVF